MLPKPMRISIACGGTGGHTFPGLAVGRALVERGHEVEVLAAGRAIEGATLKGWGGPVFLTGAPKAPARSPFGTLASVVRIVRRFRRQRPDVLLAMGSYASLPPVVAAWMLRIPAVLHEANAVPGKAISFLARFAKAVGIFFPECSSRFRPGTVTEKTGLPVRQELLSQPEWKWEKSESGAPLTIFVTGGSQGAYAMNKLVAEALASLASRPGMPAFRVIHQTGGHLDAESSTRERYAAAGVEAQVFPFISQMGGAYKAADMVIARAGAATCAEIALFGKPALFVPLPSAVRDHQQLNARHFESVGAAKVVRQCEGSDAIAEAVASMLFDPARLAALAKAAHDEAVPDAAERVVGLVEKVASRRQSEA